MLLCVRCGKSKLRNFIFELNHIATMILLLRRTLVHFYLYSAKRKLLSALIVFLFSNVLFAQNNLFLNDSGYFEKRGWNVMVFSNKYGLFGDE